MGREASHPKPVSRAAPFWRFDCSPCSQLRFLEPMKELPGVQVYVPKAIGRVRKGGQDAEPVGREAEENPGLIQPEHLEGRKADGKCIQAAAAFPTGSAAGI